jgi:hypothetical protein
MVSPLRANKHRKLSPQETLMVEKTDVFVAWSTIRLGNFLSYNNDFACGRQYDIYHSKVTCCRVLIND